MRREIEIWVDHPNLVQGYRAGIVYVPEEYVYRDMVTNKKDGTIDENRSTQEKINLRVIIKEGNPDAIKTLPSKVVK